MTRLTVLNRMAGEHFEAALDQHVAWGLDDLDLKDCVFGKVVADLTDAEVRQADELISARGLSVYCLSTSLFHCRLDEGSAPFQRDLAVLDRVIDIANVLKPTLIRLLAPSLGGRRASVANSVEYLRTDHPWLFPILVDAVDRISRAGFKATFENEWQGCCLGSPEEVIDFFATLRRPGAVTYTWDVQNMWQMGHFPTVELYRQLQPVVGYVHLKGGSHDAGSSSLRWRTSLEHASWPVLEITECVVTEGGCPVICINPSHGADRTPPNHGRPEDATGNDIEFLRREVPALRKAPSSGSARDDLAAGSRR